MGKEVVGHIVYKDTGEYKDIHDGDIVKITSKEQQDAIKKTYQTQQLNDEIKDWNYELGGFIFVLFKYINNIFEQHKELLAEDITKLFYIATYVNFEGYLIYNDNFMTRNQMQFQLQLSRNAFDTFFNKLKQYNILSMDDDKHIKINKEYFSKGEFDKDIHKYLNYTRMYIKTIQYLYNHVPLRNHRQLGNYFKLIPYIHRQQNVLCWNPDSQGSEIILMNAGELKDILGYHKKTIINFIDEMVETKLDNGESILGFFVTNKDKNLSKIIINPKVIYGGNFNLKEGKNAVIKWFK